ncbi:hypothetical protein AM1BK_07660 [Neobacillus kokaensis]|uniref:Uncharacterized protein n=1 Tax=Neobacillus kokaensis TaxID=2759023 RepID=A0ABQ3MX11_9BACI|nr:hypothetical protein AM1BK_07660 [Neobacillus kokaensis]
MAGFRKEAGSCFLKDTYFLIYKFMHAFLQDNEKSLVLLEFFAEKVENKDKLIDSIVF